MNRGCLSAGAQFFWKRRDPLFRIVPEQAVEKVNKGSGFDSSCSNSLRSCSGFPSESRFQQLLDLHENLAADALRAPIEFDFAVELPDQPRNRAAAEPLLARRAHGRPT